MLFKQRIQLIGQYNERLVAAYKTRLCPHAAWGRTAQNLRRNWMIGSSDKILAMRCFRYIWIWIMLGKIDLLAFPAQHWSSKGQIKGGFAFANSPLTFEH